MTEPEVILETLAEANPDALLFDGFEDALVGIARQQYKPPLAVYDREKCLEILRTRDGMTHEEAEEMFSFNTEGAWLGEHTPLILTSPPQADEFGDLDAAQQALGELAFLRAVVDSLKTGNPDLVKRHAKLVLSSEGTN